MPRKKLVRDLSTPEAREIWQFVKKVAAQDGNMTINYKVWPNKHCDEANVVSVNFDSISCENIPEDFKYQMLGLLDNMFYAVQLNEN